MPTNKKTLGTSVINSPMSPPSLMLLRIFFIVFALLDKELYKNEFNLKNP